MAAASPGGDPALTLLDTTQVGLIHLTCLCIDCEYDHPVGAGRRLLLVLLPCCVHRTVSAQEETTSAAEVLELLHHADSCDLDQLPPEGPTFTGAPCANTPMPDEQDPHGSTSVECKRTWYAPMHTILCERSVSRSCCGGVQASSRRCCPQPSSRPSRPRWGRRSHSRCRVASR